MLNLSQIITNIGSAEKEITAIQDLYKLQDYELRVLRSCLDSIRSSVSAEIGRKAAVSSGGGDAFKVFCRIIRNVDEKRPALQGAFYTSREHFLAVCDGYHAIRLFNSTINPPMLAEGLTPINLDPLFDSAISAAVDPQRIELPTAKELKAYVKMETAKRRATVSKKYDRDWAPLYAVSVGPTIRAFNAAYLIDVLEAIPDAAVYASENPKHYDAIYLKGTDGDAIVLPVRLYDSDLEYLLAKSEALQNGTYFTCNQQTA